MGIVTLTTDLGYRDHYLAIVKARLISKMPSVQIIDLSCEIHNNNVSDASYVLRNSLPHFPAETIHLVAIKFTQEKSELNAMSTVDNSRFLMTRLNDQYILSPDTGLFHLLDPNFNETVYQIYYNEEHKKHFYLKDIFADAALHLLEGKAPEEIAHPVKDFHKATQFESFLNGNILKGRALYIDDFGNIITNITRDKFEKAVGNKTFSITLPGRRINSISQTYDDVKHGATLVFFNSAGYLEVAINGNNAYNMLIPKDPNKKFDFNLLIEIHD
ncbi:MAG TPA: SAM-dependent chlorinase/fluorinase [Bacteroidia bacterium]|nr:SAM-dependent chlorinase/fluorinase [Bacteroidia bacterium]